jgi:Peptidase A4 family
MYLKTRPYNICVGAMALILATNARAQVAASEKHAETVPPGVVSGVPEGVTLVPPPPPGFDPTTASPEQNARYAIPPAPDAQKAPEAHAAWAAAVTATAVRESPVLTKTNITHWPMRTAGGSSPVSNNTVSGHSSNWSGSSTVNFTNAQNLEAIVSYFVVPTAHQAFGACTGGWDYSSVWPGIDGNGSGDVLQGGVEVDAYCSAGTKTSFYSPWIEWYPFSETRVSSPAIQPGDYVYVEVWNVSTTSGYVYFHDYSSNVSAEYNLTPPSGTTLTGNSVEWIVERPGINGGLATLTNYIDVTLNGGVAWDYTASPVTNYYPFTTPSVGTLELLTMIDNNSQNISTGYGLNGSSLFYEDYGSACSTTSTAPPC